MRLMVYFDIPYSQYIYFAAMLALALIGIGSTGWIKEIIRRKP